MGYAGYVPAKLPPSALTPLQSALFAVSSPASLEIIEKLVYNAVVSPQESKFKKIRLGNPKIKAVIVETAGALDALRVMGWVESVEEETGEAVLLLQKQLSMAVVRDVQEAGARAKKTEAEAARAAARAASRPASSLGSSDSRESLRALLQADRLERAAREPIIAASKAQTIGSGEDKPRIRSAGDAGLNRG